MLVLDDRFDLPGVRRIGPRLAVVIAPLNDMPEMVDHTGRDEGAAPFIEGDAPGVAGSLGPQFEFVGARMQAEHGRVEDMLAPLVRDVTLVEDAVESIQPAVGSPGERIGKLVGVGPAEPGDDHLAGVGPVIAVGVFQEENVGGVGHPDPAVTDGDGRGNVQPLGKHGHLVGGAIAVGVFEDFDAIASHTGGPAGVFEAFADPDAAPFIEAHRDWVDQVGFVGDQFDLEALRNPHVRQRFLGGEGWSGGFVLGRGDDRRGRRDGPGNDQPESQDAQKQSGEQADMRGRDQSHRNTLKRTAR